MNVIVVGCDGSGKSTICNIIKKLTDYKVINLKKNNPTDFFIDKIIVKSFESIKNKYIKFIFLYTFVHLAEFLRNLFIINIYNNTIFDRYPIDRIAIAVEGTLKLKERKSFFYTVDVLLRLIWCLPNLIFLLNRGKIIFIERSANEIYKHRKSDYRSLDDVRIKIKSYDLIYNFLKKFKKNI